MKLRSKRYNPNKAVEPFKARLLPVFGLLTGQIYLCAKTVSRFAKGKCYIAYVIYIMFKKFLHFRVVRLMSYIYVKLYLIFND